MSRNPNPRRLRRHGPRSRPRRRRPRSPKTRKQPRWPRANPSVSCSARPASEAKACRSASWSMGEMTATASPRWVIRTLSPILTRSRISPVCCLSSLAPTCSTDASFRSPVTPTRDISKHNRITSNLDTYREHEGASHRPQAYCCHWIPASAGMTCGISTCPPAARTRSHRDGFGTTGCNADKAPKAPCWQAEAAGWSVLKRLKPYLTRFMYSSQSCGPTKRLMMPPRAMNKPKGRALRRCIFPAAMSRPPVTAPSKAPRNTARAA